MFLRVGTASAVLHAVCETKEFRLIDGNEETCTRKRVTGVRRGGGSKRSRWYSLRVRLVVGGSLGGVDHAVAQTSLNVVMTEVVCGDWSIQPLSVEMSTRAVPQKPADASVHTVCIRRFSCNRCRRRNCGAGRTCSAIGTRRHHTYHYEPRVHERNVRGVQPESVVYLGGLLKPL